MILAKNTQQVNDMNKTWDITATISKWVIIILTPFLLLSASIAICFNDASLYHRGYVKYDVERVTGIDLAELDRATDEIIDYFNTNDGSNIDINVTKNGKMMPLFKDKEIHHMYDVRGLVQLDYKILRITLIVNLILMAFLIWKKYYKQAAKALFGGSLFSVGLMATLGIAMAIDFEDLFIAFHMISFSNDDWLLDPTTDYLIMMYPEGFWFDALLRVVLIIVAFIIVLGVGGFLWKRKLLKDSEK